MSSTLDELEQWIPQHRISCEAVSHWSIGMQLHHSFQVAEGIANLLIESEPGAAKPSFSLVRSIVMLTGWIPRGKGKAPERSHPPAEPTEQDIREIAARARQATANLINTDPLSWWEHPLFGVMRRDPSIRFIDIHSRHHLRIVRDIAAKAKA